MVVASTPKTALPKTFTNMACTFKIGLYKYKCRKVFEIKKPEQKNHSGLYIFLIPTF
jgi:hypothetical protein